MHGGKVQWGMGGREMEMEKRMDTTGPGAGALVDPIRVVDVAFASKRQHLPPHMERLRVHAGSNGFQFACFVRLELGWPKATLQQQVVPGLC